MTLSIFWSKTKTLSPPRSAPSARVRPLRGPTLARFADSALATLGHPRSLLAPISTPLSETCHTRQCRSGSFRILDRLVSR